MTSIMIYNATETDLPRIVEIYNAAIPGRQATGDLEDITVESRLDWFRQHNPHSYPIWVARIEDEIVGWLSVQMFYGRAAYAKTAEISIYIDPNHQGKGIGKKLVEHMFKGCCRLDLTTLVCFIFAHNIPSINLFKSFGFESWGYLPEVALMDGIERDIVVLGRKLSMDSK